MNLEGQGGQGAGHWSVLPRSDYGGIHCSQTVNPLKRHNLAPSLASSLPSLCPQLFSGLSPIARKSLATQMRPDTPLQSLWEGDQKKFQTGVMKVVNA